MGEVDSAAALREYALRALAADRYPDDFHTFRVYECDACGVAPLTLVVEHHTGSTEGSFRGTIDGRCERCGHRKRLFSFTGKHRRRERTEEPTCRCGQGAFVVGECERFEGNEGLSGFFDEGVVVGRCVGCGRMRVLVRTD